MLPLGQACTTRCSTRHRPTCRGPHAFAAVATTTASTHRGGLGAEPPAAGGREVLGAKAAGGNGGLGAEPLNDGNFYNF